MTKLSAAVVGCGLIGQRRVKVIYENPNSSLKFVVDVNEKVVREVSEKYKCRWARDWRKVVRDPRIDLVVVSTPNHLLCPIACSALSAGKDVLIEKPMGRNLREAIRIQETAIKYKRKLKIGFNHRYHPAIQKARQLFSDGVIGKAINIRCQYGHGGRFGYEKEWRGNYKLAGGGELTDQGVHLIDLIQWFCGKPSAVFSVLQTAFWKIKPAEDNAFVTLQYKNGLVANFHTSWTQWKNLFCFEIFGTKGFLNIHGLGGSYGDETLTIGLRKRAGGVPIMRTQLYQGADESWKKEWEDFISAIRHRKFFMGNADEGVSVMKTLDGIYRSCRLKRTVSV